MQFGLPYKSYIQRSACPWTLLLAVLSLVQIAAAAEPTAAPLKPRPNILIFFIDDLGCRDIGVDGSTFHETPNLDALAKSGVRFTDFYSGHPVCSPTRAALMTGKVPQRVGITDWIHPENGIQIPAEEVTLGEAFQANGYQTGYIGKWHLGEGESAQPPKNGFAWTKGVNRGGAPGSYYFPYKRTDGYEPKLWDVPDFADGKKGDYLTDVLSASAIDFIKQRDKEKPFLLCFGQYAVHTPIQPPLDLQKKYQDKRAKLFGDSKTPEINGEGKVRSRARQDNADYAAMIENLDTNIGRVLKYLDDAGLRENTIVIFTSDNGGLSTLDGHSGPTCNLPLRNGKGWTYEGGIRIPMYISWPAGLKPATCNTPGYTADFYPTLLELCDMPQSPKQHLDGRSLASALRGTPDETLAERPIAWYYPHEHGSGHRPSAAMRRGKWKLVHSLVKNKSELYDLSSDPGEQKEISAANADVTKDLEKQLLAWIAETTGKGS